MTTAHDDREKLGGVAFSQRAGKDAVGYTIRTQEYRYTEWEPVPQWHSCSAFQIGRELIVQTEVVSTGVTNRTVTEPKASFRGREPGACRQAARRVARQAPSTRS